MINISTYEKPSLDKFLKEYAQTKLVEKLPSTATSILELGCGRGVLAYTLAEAGYDVEAIDINQSAVQGAVFDAVIHADCQTYASKEPVDVVLAHYVLTHLTTHEIRRTMQQTRKNLVEKGAFVFTITNPQTRSQEVPWQKLVFSKPYTYTQVNAEFSVFLKQQGSFIDVGIRDIHWPTEVLENIILEEGFMYEKEEIYNPIGTLRTSYALLYTLTK